MKWKTSKKKGKTTQNKTNLNLSTISSLPLSSVDFVEKWAPCRCLRKRSWISAQNRSTSGMLKRRKKDRKSATVEFRLTKPTQKSLFLHRIRIHFHVCIALAHLNGQRAHLRLFLQPSGKFLKVLNFFMLVDNVFLKVFYFLFFIHSFYSAQKVRHVISQRPIYRFLGSQTGFYNLSWIIRDNR